MNEDDCFIVGIGDVKNSMKQSLPELSSSFDSDKNSSKDNVANKNSWIKTSMPTVVHYMSLMTQGLLVWGLLWCAWGDGWSWNGKWFKPAFLVVIAWAGGLFAQKWTGLPPQLAALVIGITARNLNYLDMREYPHEDNFLRKIYPVIILGKSSLAWDLKFMKDNWRQVATLGAVPWASEVLTHAVCMRYFFQYPWAWGFLLGSLYASLSCAVVAPTIAKISSDPDRTRDWSRLYVNCGAIDTSLSVGVFGIVYTYIFNDADDAYRYTKLVLTIVVGIVMGVAWGSLAKLMPNSKDPYFTELRVLFVLLGGMFANFLSLRVGWVGAGAVAVLVCNATAAHHWAKNGWKLNKNPASTTYRVLWAALEPAVFAYTGTYFEFIEVVPHIMLKGFGILLICLAVRLTCAYLMCQDMTVKERLFICCTWSPKTIVQAVLCPLAINTLILQGRHHQPEMEHAEQVMRLVIETILIMTPVGFLAVKHLGPRLLRNTQSNA